MRLPLVLVVLLAFPTLAAPQSRHRDRDGDRRPAQRQDQQKSQDRAPALPSIGLPLPQLGLPLPSLGLPPDTDAARRGNQSKPPDRNDRPGHGRQHDGRGGRSRPTVVLIAPPYGWDYAAPPPPPEEPQAGTPPALPTGSIQLDILPAGIVQLYVDGYYVGTPDDLNGELRLEAGPHRLELRAPGYQSETVDVQIEAGRTISYRGALEPLDRKEAPAAAPPADAKPPARKPIYVIPGCYLGNVPPKEAGLPPGCDPSRMKVLGQ